MAVLIIVMVVSFIGGLANAQKICVRTNLLRRKKYVTIKHMKNITSVLNVFLHVNIIKNIEAEEREKYYEKQFSVH